MINLVKFPRNGLLTQDFFGPMESVMNSLFNDALEAFPDTVKSTQSGRLYPKTDIYKEGNNLVFEAVVPFLNKENLSVEVKDGNMLYITGKCETDKTTEDREYFRKELRRSKFTRTFVLPDPVVDSYTELSAEFKDGVLVVVFENAYKPKDLDKSKSKLIEIK